MPDPFEKSAGIGDAPTAQPNPAPTQGTPGAGPQDFNLNTPVPDATLEDTRKSLLGDYTRKTQEVAEQRKELQALKDELRQEREQIRAMSQAVQTQNRFTEGRGSKLSEQIEQVHGELNPQAKLILDSLDSAFESKSAELSKRLEKLAQENEQLKQTLGSQMSLSTRQRSQALINEVSEKYGQEVAAQFGDQIQQAAANAPNLTADQAVMFLAPQAYEKRKETEAFARAKEMYEQQLGGSLEGMLPQPGSAPAEAFEPGESWGDSFKRAVGPSEFTRMVVQDAFSKQ